MSAQHFLYCVYWVFIKDYHGAAGTVWDGTGVKVFGLPLSMGLDPIVSFSAPVVTEWDGTICV